MGHATKTRKFFGVVFLSFLWFFVGDVVFLSCAETRVWGGGWWQGEELI